MLVIVYSASKPLHRKSLGLKMNLLKLWEQGTTELKLWEQGTTEQRDLSSVCSRLCVLQISSNYDKCKHFCASTNKTTRSTKLCITKHIRRGFKHVRLLNSKKTAAQV